MTPRQLSNIAIMRKAGFLKMGFDQVAESIGRGCCLVVYATDLSPKSKERMETIAKKMNVRTRVLPFSIHQIEVVIGKPVGVMGITNKGFAEKLIADLEAQNIGDKSL